MTISDRIFELLKKRNMTQKDFSEATGIPQSTISDWRKKRTNPASDKVMIICHVLEVTPTYLLSGIEADGQRGNRMDYLIVDRESRDGILLEQYHRLETMERERVLGYVQALMDVTDR